MRTKRLYLLGSPPIWVLLDLDENQEIVPSRYSLQAKEAGLGLITWTLERSGSLKGGGGWYHQSIAKVINNDGDTYEVLHALVDRVGVAAVFSDWPATTTFYANCMNTP